MMNDSNPVTLDVTQNNTLKPSSEAMPAGKGRKKLRKLEAIRGFAALYVVCHHSFPEYLLLFGTEVPIFKLAQEAVMMFFILSGFVIQYAYQTSPDKSFRYFFLRRFVRIFIPLVCVFIAHYALLALTPHQPLSDSGLYSLAGNLLMLQQVPEIWNQPSWFAPFLGNKPLWTLSFEWWFYMMFFCISYFFGNESSIAAYIITAVAGITYIFFPFAVNREIMYLILWWMGADLAKLYISGRSLTISAMKTPLLVLAGIGLLTVAHFFYYQSVHPEVPLHFVFTPLIEIRHFGFCLFAVIAALLWYRINWVGFKYTFGLFEILAPISFSLYISHWFLVSHARYLDNYIENFYLRFVVYLLVCCAFCYFIERIVYPKVSRLILDYFSVRRKSLLVSK